MQVGGVKIKNTQVKQFSATRDGVIAVNKETGSFTDEYLPEHRSHLYGITAVYPYCPGGKTQQIPANPNPFPLPDIC